MKKYLTPIIFAIIVLGLVIFAAVALSSDDKAQDTGSEKTTQASGEDLIKLQSGYSQGPDGAKVTVVEFGDYQCPACANVHPTLKNELLPAYTNKIKFVFKNYPINSIHKRANISALAAEAAGAQGKYWEMHDILYEKQNDWVNAKDPKDNFIQYARELGLDLAKFESDVNNATYQKNIDDDTKLGEKLKVEGTPSFYINGQYIDLSEGGFTNLKNAIDAALAN